MLSSRTWFECIPSTSLTSINRLNAQITLKITKYKFKPRKANNKTAVDVNIKKQANIENILTEIKVYVHSKHPIQPDQITITQVFYVLF